MTYFVYLIAKSILSPWLGAPIVEDTAGFEDNPGNTDEKKSTRKRRVSYRIEKYKNKINQLLSKKILAVLDRC